MVFPLDSIGAMAGVPPSVSRYMAEIGRKGGKANTPAQQRHRQKFVDLKRGGRPRDEHPTKAALAMRKWRAENPKKRTPG